ncbi:TadE family type IV pilus minor pilin [Kocuria sp. KH4]
MTDDRPRPSPHPACPDRGAVTAETAVLLPALVLLLAVLLAAAAAGMTLIRYEEAARASARAAARGESAATVRSTARSVAGENAAVRLEDGAGTSTVVVTGPAPGILGTWGGWELRAEASADTEGARSAGGHDG